MIDWLSFVINFQSNEFEDRSHWFQAICITGNDFDILQEISFYQSQIIQVHTNL
jgi:hypothetical protein